MSKVMIVGAARDARTRHKRTAAGTRRRRVRIGGVHRVRPNRSLPFTLKQCAQYEDELMANWDAGLILFQDGNGKVLSPGDVFGKETMEAVKEALADTEPPVDEDPEEDAPEEDPEGDEGDPEGDEPEPDEDDEDEGEEGEDAAPYAEWKYPDLKDEVKARELEPESQSKVHLVEALEANDEEE